MAFTICIDVLDGGGYKVSKETSEQEAQEGAMPGDAMGEGQEDAQEPGQTVQTVEEALQLAAQMLSGDPRTEQEQVQAGYNSKRPMMAAKPTPAAVFGE